MFFRQLFDRESCTYTYLLADEDTKEALLIDPVLELVQRDTEQLKELGFVLKYCLNTHVHADHITGSGELKKIWEGCQSVLGKTGNEAAIADIKVDDNDILSMGSIDVTFLSTAGHTNGCHSFYVQDGDTRYIFTGDAVLIRGCGRTDFQQGDSHSLYKNVHEKILSLPDETLLYPAHDYRGRMVSTVGEEKKFNPRLTKPEPEFVDIMANLNLPYPAKIDASLPANLVCGLHELLPKKE